MKQIDEKSLNDLNNFLTTRKGLEICNINLADLSANYAELLTAARANQTNLAGMINNSVQAAVKVEAATTSTTTTNPTTETKTAQTVTAKVENVTKPVVSQAINESSVKQAADTTKEVETESIKSNTSTSPVTATVKPVEEAIETSATSSDVKPVQKETLTTVDSGVSVFEGSVQPNTAKKNDIWLKTEPGKGTTTLKYDGEKWNTIS